MVRRHANTDTRFSIDNQPLLPRAAIGHPELIRTRRREGPSDQVGRRPGVDRTRGRHDELAATDAPQVGGAHQARDALATHPLAPRDQFGMDPRGPIRPARVAVNRRNFRRQRGVLVRPLTRWTAVPRVVPAGGDLQHSAQGGDRMGGPVRRHEREDPEGIASVSRANQVAAFSSSPTPRGAWRCHAASGVARRARPSSDHRHASRRRDRLGAPSCESPGPLARTPGRGTRACGRHEPGRPSVDGTLLDTVGVYVTS